MSPECATALQFAEYLARSAEDLLYALSEEDARLVDWEDATELDDEEVLHAAYEQAREIRCEHVRCLRGSIYEFRRRAARCSKEEA